jgi:CBS domain-containing protein
MKTRRKIIPDVVSGQSLVRLSSRAKAREAAVMMNDSQVSSVLVVDAKDNLRGIFTVRDVARRIVGDGMDPDATSLSKVMTKNPTCVAANDTPQTALRLMQEGGFRHLPVTDDGSSNGKLLGIVSRRIFYPEEVTLLEFEKRLWENIR